MSWVRPPARGRAGAAVRGQTSTQDGGRGPARAFRLAGGRVPGALIRMVGRFAWVTGMGIVALGLVSAPSGAHGGLSAATRDARDECGPLVAPAQLLCVGQRHMWVRFLALFATPGSDFTGTISVHLDHVLPYRWDCAFVNGLPAGYCTEEGVFPRSGMPFDFRCTAEGAGVWGCSLQHA